MTVAEKTVEQIKAERLRGGGPGMLALHLADILYRAGRSKADSIVTDDGPISFAEYVQRRLDAI